MKSTDDLFQLINSMSKSEKGYFKKFASKHTIGEKNIYVKLFDEIEAKPAYDEAALKKKFQGEKFAKNLYSTKNYLFNLILKSLSAYHAEKYVVSKLHTMMIELNVLFEKGLYKQFKTLLNKAISLAKENDKPFYLALLYNKEMTSLATDYYSDTEPMDFEMLKTSIRKNLNHITLNEEYHILYNEMFLFTKETGSVRNQNDLEKLNRIIDHPLLKDGSLAVTFDAKFKYNNIMGHYYRIMNDNDKWLHFRRELLQLMESDKKYIRENPRSYILALNNYLHACLLTGKFSEFDSGMIKLKQFARQFEDKKEYIDIQTRTFLLVSDLELNFAIRKLKLESLKSIIEEIEVGFEKFGGKIVENRKKSLFNRIAFGSFIIKDYDKSIKYINYIMNTTNPKIEPEQHSFARIRNLVTHFELGNYDLLEYAVNSTKRFLAKSDRIYKFEKLVLNFVVKVMKADDEAAKRELYEKLRYDLVAISNDPFEKNALEQFDLISWLDSKIKKKDLGEILKDKKAA